MPKVIEYYTQDKDLLDDTHVFCFEFCYNERLWNRCEEHSVCWKISSKTRFQLPRQDWTQHSNLGFSSVASLEKIHLRKKGFVFICLICTNGTIVRLNYFWDELRTLIHHNKNSFAFFSQQVGKYNILSQYVDTKYVLHSHSTVVAKPFHLYTCQFYSTTTCSSIKVCTWWTVWFMSSM